MTAFEAEVLDVGGAGLADLQAVQAEQDRQRGVVRVVLLRSEQEGAEFGAVEAASIRDVDLWAPDVLRWVDAIRPSMWANR